ncbi:MAG: RDD family protein [Pyrinomonadaceae bacterium]|nr:RDD family protein [Pyrinomonadaceae bacterium]
MMNDSVREELQTKITPSAKLRRIEMSVASEPLAAEPKPVLAPPPRPMILEQIPAPVDRPALVRSEPVNRVVTANLTPKATSPTLVEFQNKNIAVPEWRLQMQNAVRQRKGLTDDSIPVNVAATQGRLATQGATALKAEVVEDPLQAAEIENADPRLGAALKRIAESRRAFLPDDPKAPASKAAAAKNFPFNVVAPTPNKPARPPMPASTPVRPKPAMVAPLRMELKLDTNKLPRIETVIPAPAVEAPPAEETEVSKLPLMPSQTEFTEVNRILINSEHEDPELDEVYADDDEIEDLAPLSMRFNAGLFDLIIAVSVSMLALSPFALAGGDWFSRAGVLTFVGTCAIVTFAYLTAAVGFFGKTLGMRLFALELVDAEANEYPSIHQAAVSSSVFILSIIFAGIGFIPMLFNDERRAAHDLLSGTIIVREF